MVIYCNIYLIKGIEGTLAFLTLDSGISVNSAPATKKKRTIRSQDLIIIEYRLHIHGILKELLIYNYYTTVFIHNRIPQFL